MASQGGERRLCHQCLAGGLRGRTSAGGHDRGEEKEEGKGGDRTVTSCLLYLVVWQDVLVYGPCIILFFEAFLPLFGTPIAHDLNVGEG